MLAGVALCFALLPATARGEDANAGDRDLTRDGDARWEPVFQQGGVAVVRNRRAMPRAWLVGRVEAASAVQALRRIRGETRAEFDPRETALLELRDTSLPRVDGGSAPGDTATTRASADGHIIVDTHSDKPSFLVVSESYFPGWKATVDGKGTPIYQTDYVLLGVAVPAGSHRIEMHYLAPGAALGSLISLATLCVLLGMGLYTWRRRFARIPTRGTPV
jgi:hypothetical protein